MGTPWSTWILTAILLSIFIQIAACQDIVKKIAEEKGKDVYILNIQQSLKKSIIPNTEYRVITGQEYVSISQDGDLRTKSKMDREVLCPDNRPKCTVDIEVLVLVSTLPPKMVKVQLIITDVNDNDPTFENSEIVKEISELTAVGTLIRLDSAVDPDYGANSISGYSIEVVEQPGVSKRTKPYFELGVIENIDGTKIPQLKLLRKFDREEMAVHELDLIAVDGGTPPNKGIARVRINVTDSNDNQPTFEEKSYIFGVPEDMAPNSVIAKVLATDKDKGINGQIKYSFPSVVSSIDREMFSLNANNGEITIKKLLDYEKRQMHHLTVEAEDMGPNPTSAYTTVTIKVLDVNDNKPQIHVKFFSASDVEEGEGMVTASIPEDADIGTYLAFVTITDGDKGINGTVACKMDSDKFVLKEEDSDDNRYLLKTIDTLDRETKDTYNLLIEAWDFGTAPLTNSMQVVMKIGDVNDNAPKFDHPEFIAGVNESARLNHVFQILKADDHDIGENAKVSYKFKETKDFITTSDGDVFMLTDLFAIDEKTGEVRLIKEGVLDAETEENPGKITVEAYDHGNPPMNTTTVLKISVIDDNDNSPQFEDVDEYVFRINEHSPYGSFVGGVHATDKDITKTSNALVTYSLKQVQINGRPANDPWYNFFRITKAGEVHFYGDETKLDRESNHPSPITFVVVAKDSGASPLSDQKLMKIYLLDINDNAPIVASPNVSKDVAFVRIPTSSGEYYDDTIMAYGDVHDMPTEYRQQQRGHFASSVIIDRQLDGGQHYPSLVHIIANDPDEGENSHISYTIVDGNRDDYFIIDPMTGNISFVPDVDFSEMEHGCQVLKVIVKDLADEPMSATTWVNIYITDKSEQESNATKAMLECKKNSLYPHYLGRDKIKTGGFGKYTTYIIAGMVALVCIIIIAIIIVLCVKCNCCGGAAEKKYPIGGGIYSADKRKRTKQNLYEPNPRQFGDESRRHPNGTVDSRSSFYSEWTQSQNQMIQEKQDHVGNLPTQSNRDSVASHNSGRDSGTGDSMPSDAYHGVNQHQQRNQDYPSDMYPPQQYRNIPPNYQHPDEYDGPMPDHGPLVVNLPPEGVFSAKCTDDCKMYGHSDACWMPDSLQRPVSRVTTFRGQPYDSNSLKHRQPDPNDMRYTPQSYYYDPVNKFDNEYPPYSTGTGGRGGGGFSSFQESPVDAKRLSQSQGGPAFPPSAHASFRSNQSGPRIPQNHEEANSNLSSTSSNNPNHYNQGYPRNQQFYPQHPYYHDAPQVGSPYGHPYYDPSGYNPQQQMFQPSYHHEPSEGEPLNFEEDYSASNLLSPQDADARYFMPSDNPLPGPHSNYPEYMQYQDQGDTQKLMKNEETNESNPTGDDDSNAEEKLKPIREDIDAEEVVNEINTLLLDDNSPSKKSLDPRFYGNEV